MRRLFLLIGVLALTLGMSAPAHAKGGPPPNLVSPNGLQIFNPNAEFSGAVISQQPPAINPFNPGNPAPDASQAVVWDQYDYSVQWWNGPGAQDAEVTSSLTMLLDNAGHFIQSKAEVNNGRTLQTTVSVPELGFSYTRSTAGPAMFCVGVPTYALNDPALTAIPDSNGGVAKPVTVTVTHKITDHRGIGNQSRLWAQTFRATSVPAEMIDECGGATVTALGGGFVLVAP